MLDKNILYKKIVSTQEKIIDKNDFLREQLLSAWYKIINNTNFKKLIEWGESRNLPLWQNELKDTFQQTQKIKNYSITGVDGSQVYPNRHTLNGHECFLINIGSCTLSYYEKSSATFSSTPEIYFQKDFEGHIGKGASWNDIVDLEREYLELVAAIKLSQNLSSKKKHIVLLDGSLIFWYLENKDKETKQYFYKKYLEALNLFYENNLIVASYISSPKNTELIHLIRVAECKSFTETGAICSKEQIKNCPCFLYKNNFDKEIISIFLSDFSRTTIFYPHSPILQKYPDHLKPCFFYIKTNKEVVRIELPTWVANDKNITDLLFSACIDQIEKGLGYPVALAEAHNQAVINTNDRNFFINTIKSFLVKKNCIIQTTQKELKKQRLGF